MVLSFYFSKLVFDFVMKFTTGFLSLQRGFRELHVESVKYTPNILGIK